MPSDKQTRRQRHQAAVKPQRGKAIRGAQATEFVKGAGFRKSEFVGGKKYYTPMSMDPNSSGAGGDITNISISGSGGGTSTSSDAVLANGTVPFHGRQIGVYPTENSHLATKLYVDTMNEADNFSISDGTTTEYVYNGNTITFADGTAINAVVSATDTVTINNTGVTSNVAGTAIGVSGATGAVTISNTGVISNVAGTGISVSSATGNVTVANTGVVSVSGTSNEVDVSAATGSVAIGLPNAVTVATSLTTPRIISSGDITLEPAGEDVLPLGNADIDMGDYNRMFRTLYASELYVETLVAQDVLATIGGRIMVAPTTKLIADLSSGATTIDVEHNNITGKYVIMKTAPGGIAQTETFKISSSSPSSITGGYRYNITSRNLDGTGANSWVEGDAACSVGGSVGEGFIDLTSTSTVLNHAGPTMAIYARTGTGNWNDLKPTVAVGQLSSFVDYSGNDKFGIAIGNDITLAPTNGFKGLTADNTNGLRMFNTPIELYNSAEKRAKFESTGIVKLGRYIDGTGGTEALKFHWDGSSLSITGDITVSNGGDFAPTDATANDTDANLKNRNNHSGTQGLSSLDSTIISGGKIITGLLTADNIQTGTLSAGRISAGSLRASKITAGGANLIPSPEQFTSWANLATEGWSIGGTSADGYYETGTVNGQTYNSIKVGGNGYAESPYIEVDPSQTYRLKLDMTHHWINNSYGDGNFGVLIRFYDSSNNQINVGAVNASGTVTSTTTGVSAWLFTSGYLTNTEWIHMDRLLFTPSATQDQMRGGGNILATAPSLGGGATLYSSNYKMLNATKYIKVFLVQESTNYRYGYFGNISFTPVGSGFGEITGSKIRTAISGKRVEIDGANNNLKFYDSSNNQVCRIDDNVFSSGGNDYPGFEITSDRAFFRVSDAGINEGYLQFYNEIRAISIPPASTGSIAHYSSIMRDENVNYPNSSSKVQSFYADARNDGSGDAYGMYIATGLAAKPSGGDWASASDSRVKTIGDNYITGLTELVQLQPKYYKYNGKADGAPNDGVDYVGLIAQEAETVIPSLVSQGKSEIDSVEVDDFRMLDTSELQYAIINAVKELNTRLIALEG